MVAEWRKLNGSGIVMHKWGHQHFLIPRVFWYCAPSVITGKYSRKGCTSQEWNDHNILKTFGEGPFKFSHSLRIWSNICSHKVLPWSCNNGLRLWMACSELELINEWSQSTLGRILGGMSDSGGQRHSGKFYFCKSKVSCSRSNSMGNSLSFLELR